jgi:hypothetical protein
VDVVLVALAVAEVPAVTVEAAGGIALVAVAPVAELTAPVEEAVAVVVAVVIAVVGAGEAVIALATAGTATPVKAAEGP